jgi:hypothetical protein
VHRDDRSEISRSLEAIFMTLDSAGNLTPKTTEGALITAQAYLISNQPAPGNPKGFCGPCFIYWVRKTPMPKGFKLLFDNVKFDGTQEPRTWLDDYPTSI